MHYNHIVKAIILCFFVSGAVAQDVRDYQSLHFTSSHTSFPDTGRVNNYVYDSVFYEASAHYRDSSVLLIIPSQLDTTKKIDLVFWFHGWHNNIDTTAVYYELIKQFIASKRNAVLVLSETARNAPDSYGGKLEQPGMFKSLLNDVMDEMKKKGIVSHMAVPGKIVLAGHSGAFQVIAYILRNGLVKVQEVFLFDALYGQLDKYSEWISADQSNHFVHWFTNHGGGTDKMSEIMMLQLKTNHIDYVLPEEGTITPKIIKSNRILFVHSPREHNVIINNPDDFQLLLENSFVLQPYSKGKNSTSKN